MKTALPQGLYLFSFQLTDAYLSGELPLTIHDMNSNPAGCFYALNSSPICNELIGFQFVVQYIITELKTV